MSNEIMAHTFRPRILLNLFYCVANYPKSTNPKVELPTPNSF